MLSTSLPLAQPPKSICILRLSALGDVCNAVPAVRALQRQWPDAHITWIVGKLEQTLLDGMQGVELIPYDKRSGLRGIVKLRKQLRTRRFDVLLHMQAALRASFVSLAVRADLRVGFDRSRAKDYQHWFTRQQIPPHPCSHVLEGFMDMARALGVQDDSLHWDMPIPETALQDASQLVGQARYLLLSPCSSQRIRNFRNWSVDGYAAAVKHAYQAYGLRSVITGGNSIIERDYAQGIAARVPEAVTNLVGKTSIKTLLALVKGAEFVMGPDSGPMHMATATGVPALGLYAGSNPDRTGPYLSRQWVVNRYPDQVRKVFGCDVADISWGRRVREPDVMDSITVEDVITKIDAVMGALDSHPAAQGGGDTE